MKGAYRRSFLFSIAILAALSFSACESAPPLAGGEPYYRSAPAPDWHGERLSWSKLDHIQTWLDGAGPRRWPDALPGAELELAQGRLDLTAKDAATLQASLFKARLARAEAGFRRVLGNDATSSLQRREANSGLEGIRAQKAAFGSSPAGGIYPRSAWGAQAPNTRNLSEHRGSWSRITVHHSDTAVGGRDLGSSELAIRKLQKEHMNRTSGPNGSQHWGDLGYHFLIDPEGRIFQGRSLRWRGAHAGNATTNAGNIGICMLGEFEHSMPGAPAMRALERLIGDLSRKHGIRASHVYGHSDFKNTICPGKPLLGWVRRYSAHN